MRFPSIAAVAKALRAAQRETDWRDGEEPWRDVRLQVYENGAWAIRFGPSDYDLDHRGFWGASSIPKGRFRSFDVAREIISQARDQRACVSDE